MKVRIVDGRDEISLEYGGIAYKITKEGTELPDGIALFFVNHNSKILEVVKEDSSADQGSDDTDDSPDNKEPETE